MTTNNEQQAAELTSDLTQELGSVTWKVKHMNDGYILHTLLLVDDARITVLNRGIDIETAFRDRNGQFWLASVDFDIRRSGNISIGEAIALIKANANTCIAD